jgi:hypothetical protein
LTRKHSSSTWPIYEEITEKYYRQRYYYGEAQGDKLLTGRIVRWYRTFNGIVLTPIQPIVRFHHRDGTEGEPEYVELGTTENYWIAAAVDDLHEAWQRARLTGTFPRPHGDRHTHPADPFYVDPAHFLLVYGELLDDELQFGRVVGWDPPKFADELPHPMVRLYRDDGSLYPEPLYVGSLYQPQHYWIDRSEEAIRQRVES